MSNNFFSLENPAFCEIMWKNGVELDGPHMTDYMVLAQWVLNA